MKHVLTLIALLLPCSALAEKPTLALCDSLSKAAAIVMTSRQANTDMADLMKAASDNKLMTRMVIAAYEKPAFSSEPFQKKAIKQFANEYYLACAKEIVR